MSQSPSIVAVGTTTVDAILTIGDRQIRRGEKEILPATPYTFQPGGMASRTACLLGMCGASVQLVSSFLQSAVVDFKAYFEKHNVSLRFSQTDARATTMSVILVGSDSTRTVFMGITEDLVGQQLDKCLVVELLQKSDVLYLDGSGNLTLQFQLACQAEQMKNGPKHVLVQLESDRDEVARLVRRASTVVCSEDFLRRRFGVDADPADALMEMAKTYAASPNMAPAAIGVTLGEFGSVFYDIMNCRLIRTSALPVNVVDSTCAGDAHQALLAYGLAKELPLDEALRLAAAAGSMAVRELGFPEKFCMQLCQRQAKHVQQRVQRPSFCTN